MDEQLQNQLARRLGLLLTPQDSITDETLVKLVLFLATEYDRGVQVGYKKGLEQNHPYFSQRKAEYDRGKVEGAIEELERLKTETKDIFQGQRINAKTGRVEVMDSKIVHERDIAARLKELKSKGEVK